MYYFLAHGAAIYKIEKFEFNIMIKFIRACSVLIFLVASITAPYEAYSDEISDLFYKEGLKKYILKDYVGAITDFENAYRLDKENIIIKNMYLHALIKQGNNEYENNNLMAAKEYFTLALELSDMDEELQQQLSLIQERIEVEKVELPTKVEQPTEKTIEEKPKEPKIESTDTGKEEETASEVTAPVEVETKRELIPAPTIVQVEMPFDIDEFLRQQQEENKRILNEIIQTQKEERENLVRNMEIIAQSQREDRQFFNRSLLLVIAGAGGIVLVPIIAIVVLVFLRRRNRKAEPVYEVSAALADRSTLLLEAAENLDETKYIAEEHYSEIVRAKRLRDLYQEFVSGNLAWDTVSEYISELNHELKSEILSAVEKKLESEGNKGMDATLQVLLPLITDEHADISSRSKDMTRRVADSAYGQISIGEAPTYELPDAEDPLSLVALLHLANLIDNKSGIIDHSKKVGEISALIAEKLQDPQIDPLDAQKVGLVHNIGYLEIPDHIFKQDGPLSEEQYAIVKSHPERGVHFLEYANPPAIFYEGIQYHHERLNGSGYPEGMKGKKIPLIARIIAVADSFIAATSPRPYRKALSTELALEMIGKVTGTLLDKKVYNILVKIASNQTDHKS